LYRHWANARSASRRLAKLRTACKSLQNRKIGHR
jgi:hypothetical protein